MAKPKLALIPAAQGDKFYSVLPSDGVGDFDFTRNSSATRIAPTGFIQTVESYGSELLTNGNFDNDSDWTKETGWTISGGKLVATNVTGSNACYQNPTLVAGKSYKITFEITSHTSGGIKLAVGTSSTGSFFSSVGVHTQTVVAAGTLQARFMRDLSGANVSLSIDNASIVEVVGNKSRLNYDLLNGKVVNCPHYLLEPARTNLVTYSEDFSQSTWTKLGSSVTLNSIVSPDGTLNSSKIFSNGTQPYVGITDSIVFPSVGEYTFSVYAKVGNNNFLRLQFAGVTNGSSAYYDLVNGTTSSSGASIEFIGNGWYKCILTNNLTGADLSGSINMYASYSLTSSTFPSVNDATNKNIYLWGAQVEESSYPTSYIPTNGTAITRAAESATGSGNAATFNDSEGVLMAEFSVFDFATNSKAISIYKTSSPTSNALILYYNGNRIAFDILNPSGTVSVPTNINNAKEFNKVAIKYKSGDIALWFNGVELVTRTNTLSLSGLDKLEFDFTTNNDVYGKTRELQYFDSVLTDAQLETLTSWTSLQEMITSQLYTNY